MREQTAADVRHTTLQEGVNRYEHYELPAWIGQRVLEACAAPVIVFEQRDRDCLVRYVNPAFAQRTGHSAAEIMRIDWGGLHIVGGRERQMTQLCTAIRERRELEMPFRIHGKDGLTFGASLHVSPVDGTDAGIPRFAVGVLRERTVDAEYISRLEREAHCDSLTGLPNRRLLAERAEHDFAQALREGYPLGVAVIDLEGFKLINDTLGHAAGDEVLCAVGARLARDLRPGDFVARIGGDEFVLLLQGESGDFSLSSIAERVRHRIEQPMQLRGQSITIACSIGLAVFPSDGDSLGAVLKHADRAMYRQKAWRRTRHLPDRVHANLAASA